MDHPGVGPEPSGGVKPTIQRRKCLEDHGKKIDCTMVNQITKQASVSLVQSVG